MSKGHAVFPLTCPKSILTASRSPLSPRNQSLFADVCEAVRPTSILEIGSWMGSSAVAWRNTASRHNADATVYCIDTWLGSPEHYLKGNSTEWATERLAIDPKGPTFFEDFCFNVHQAGHAHFIRPMRADSHAALPWLKKLNAAFDVIYVDGAHDSISVWQDVSHAFEILAPQGIVCGDDFGWFSVKTGLILCQLQALFPHREILYKGNDWVSLPRDRKLRQHFVSREYSPYTRRDYLWAGVRKCVRRKHSETHGPSRAG